MLRGKAQFSATVPVTNNMIGLKLQFQYVLATPVATSPCPLSLPGFSTSNILEVEVRN